VKPTKRRWDEGLFVSSYSATNEQEYWAEGAQGLVRLCRPCEKDPTVHSGIWNRQQLKDYDPRLAKLLEEVYGDGDWRYGPKTTNRPVRVGEKSYTRTPAELSHLEGLDRTVFPVFGFENSPRIKAAAELPRP